MTSLWKETEIIGRNVPGKCLEMSFQRCNKKKNLIKFCIKHKPAIHKVSMATRDEILKLRLLNFI